MSLKEVVKKSVLVLGKCLPTAKENAVKVAITRYERNPHLNIYFKDIKIIYAEDSNKVANVGDVVLLEQLPEKITLQIQHRVKEVIFPLGDVTDPITGKKVVFDKYRDEIAQTNEMFGKTESGFDYDKAPRRGWQKEKKDFYYKPVYKKYHEFENDDQPYAKLL